MSDQYTRKVGAYTAEKPFDINAHTVFNAIKKEFLEKHDKSIVTSIIVPKKYATQVVAGTNYKMTVDVNGECHQLTVWKQLNGTHTLTSSNKC